MAISLEELGRIPVDHTMREILRETDQAQRRTKPWSKYPMGTKALATMGGSWIKVERGWQWGTTGGVFPTPGGDSNGKVIVPGIPL